MTDWDTVPSLRVVVFRKDILPISETFIPAQMMSLARWIPTLVGFQRVNGLDLSHLDPLILFKPNMLYEHWALRRDQFAPFIDIAGMRLLKILRRLRPKLVHAHFGYDAVLIADAARRLQIPMLVTLHGTDILRDWSAWSEGTDGLFFKLYPKKLRALFHDPSIHFVAVSKVLMATAVARGVPSERIHLGYTGIDAARFLSIQARPSLKPMILFIGRLVDFKGCSVLIKAIARIAASGLQFRFVIAGDGPLRVPLERLAMSENVYAEFIGVVNHERVRELFSEARVFVLPSLTEFDGVFEAFGMVLLEAQAAGVPVITSAKAGPEAILPGRTGFMFPEGDSVALAEKLTYLLEHPQMAHSMGVAGRDHVRTKFEVRDCSRHIERIYDIVSEKNRGLFATRGSH